MVDDLICSQCGSTDIELGHNKSPVCEAKVHTNHAVGYWLECSDCGLETPVMPTLEEARAAWDKL